MKKYFIVMLTLALAFSFAASVASADTMMSSFNTNLTVGSTGSDVVALQSFLVSKGLLTMPSGVAMGYFGGLTKSAVAAYQVSKGITPSAGYFGPITRAAVAADSSVSVSSVAGCTAGAMFSSVTGAACTTTTTVVAGCPAGAMYNSMTGAACTTSTTTTTTTTTTGSNSNVEGSLNVQLSSNPADNASIRTQTDVPVYGIDFRASISDVTVQTVDLQVSDLNSGTNSTENPATLINTIKVWDGSNVIATVPVNLTTFTKDQNQVYYYRFSNLNFVVPVNTTKTLTFTFSTNSIDTQRVVTIQGYQSSSVRAVSGAGISDFYSINGSGYTRNQTFLKPGSSTLTLTSATTPLRSQNYRVNGSDALTGVTLATFNLKSETGDSTLLTVNASTTASGTLPTTLYLYQGSTVLKSVSVASNGSTVFNNLDTTNGSTVSQNTIQTFTIKADFPANTANGTFASTTIQSVVYETPNGNSATANGSAVVSANQYVYSAAPLITLAGTPTIQITGTNQAGSSTAMTASFPLTITAQGAAMIQPNVNGSDLTVVFSDGTHNIFASSSVVTIPNNNIADGSSANVTVTAVIPNSAVTYGGLYNAAITGLRWVDGANTVNQTYGLEDFKTSSAANFIK